MRSPDAASHPRPPATPRSITDIYPARPPRPRPRPPRRPSRAGIIPREFSKSFQFSIIKNAVDRRLGPIFAMRMGELDGPSGTRSDSRLLAKIARDVGQAFRRGLRDYFPITDRVYKRSRSRRRGYAADKAERIRRARKSATLSGSAESMFSHARNFSEGRASSATT